MGGFYLRVEGVNLGQILDDTQDLSTIRGSSLMLLDVIGEIEKRLAAKGRAPEPITTGASIGLWRILAQGKNDTEAAASDLRVWLRNGSGGSILNAARHATFVIDVTEDTGDPESYIAAREKLIARNRWRQMQEASLVYPAAGSVTASDKRACDLDLKRPAKPDKEPIKGESQAVSWSVWQRRGYGLDAKQKFYRREIGKGFGGKPFTPDFPKAIPDDGARPFPLHFESISESGDSIPRSLRRKIAVFYADGNQFSKIQDTIISDPAASSLGPHAVARQKSLDAKLKDFRRDFLWRLLWTLVRAGAIGAPAEEEVEERARLYKKRSSQIVRMETLLWGGDEFLFVLPARLGWHAARLFFDTVAGESNNVTTVGGKLPPPEKWRLGGTDLQHAAALVFCHHDAPIARIRKLAKDDLAEAAKYDRSRSFLLPIVLESFDHVGTDIDHYWNKRCPAGLKSEHLVIPAEALGLLRGAARALAKPDDGDPFPRRRLKALARALQSGFGVYGKQYEGALEDAEAAPLFTSPPMAEAIQALAPTTSEYIESQAVLIYYLEELWDYLTVETGIPE